MKPFPAKSQIPRVFDLSVAVPAFSLIELLLSMGLLSALLTLLMMTVSSLSTAMINTEQKVQAESQARNALEIITREITPAVIDTRMQFIVAPGKVIKSAGEDLVAPASPILLWMAPIGKNGDLRCVGYYLSRDEERQSYLLRRIYIERDNADGYFPRMSDFENASNNQLFTSPVDAKWFTDNWKKDAFDDKSPENKKAVVSTVARGVLGFWAQCYDTLGNPIPWVSNAKNHPQSDLMFNSASHFIMANSKPFEKGKSFLYMAESDLAMKAHRLPAEIEFGIVTVGEAELARGHRPPLPLNKLTPSGSLDLESTVDQFITALEMANIRAPETLITRVRLANGG